ncbi:MAG: copper chaperone PCu(A)C [Candidatus Latescibacterota bacterium]|nr:copper chaperone PCu(A)C [Candidatus Latescibacterota bacterium]
MKRRVALCCAGFLLLWMACGGRDESSVVVRDAWVREPPGGHPIAAAYMTIVNNSDAAMVLVGAQSPVVERVEIHTMTHEDGTMRMRQVERVPLPAGGQVVLESGGLHLMLMGLSNPPRAGDSVDLTLRFADGSARTVSASVRKDL